MASPAVVAQSCNDMDYPARSPARGVELYYLATDEFPFDGAPTIPWPHAGTQAPAPTVLTARGGLEVAHQLHQGGAHDSQVPPYQAPFVVGNHVDPVKLNVGKMGDLAAWVLYYEPNGQGGRRICRWEHWANRVATRRPNGQMVPLAKPLPPSVPIEHELNAALKNWSATHRRLQVGHYRYTEDGRLSWYGTSTRPAEQQDNPVLSKDPKDGWVTQPVQCFLYDAQGRPTRTVTIDARLDEARHLQHACEARQVGEANFLDYFYDAQTGAYRGMRSQSAATLLEQSKSMNSAEREADARRVANRAPIPAQVKWNYRPDTQPHWVRGEWQPQQGTAFSEAVQFETTLEAEGHPGRPGRYGTDPQGQAYFRYHLFDPTLVRTLLDKADPISALKQLHRLRIQKWGAGPVYEHFTPQGVLRHRLFTLGDARTVRHEQFDEFGRLKRVINLGLMNDKLKDTYYAENLAAHKDQIKVGPYLMYRVYEYDAAGKESLVAVSWYLRSPYDHLAENVVDGAIKDAKRAWQNRRQPDKAKVNNTFPPQFFGTPNGTIKWQDAASFGKAFDFYPSLEMLKQWGEAQIKASK